MVEQLNEYLGSVFTKEDTNNLPEILGYRRSSVREELSRKGAGEET